MLCARLLKRRQWARTIYVAAFEKLLKIYLFSSGPSPLSGPPQIGQKWTELAAPPPTNNPTVEPQISNTKCRPKIRRMYSERLRMSPSSGEVENGA